MTIQKKIAMSFGGAVLAACVTVGGVVAANASTPTTSQSTAAATTKAATTKTATGSTSADTTEPATTVAVPALPNHPYNWDDFIKTLTAPQQKALLAEQQVQLAKYKAIGLRPGVEKLTYNVKMLKAALGE